ncbi:MAG: nitrate reductase associated protein [Microcoleaceae cyanobacterium]
MNDLFFDFEADFVSSLHCIPMVVRYKLDTCGVKLKLAHWNQFDSVTRHQLVAQPVENSTDINAYRQLLYTTVKQYSDIPLKDLPIDPNPPWTNDIVVPDSVEQKAGEMGVKINSSQWKKLTPLQRFALIKLSRPSHENKNFLPALREFDLLDINHS